MSTTPRRIFLFVAVSAAALAGCGGSPSGGPAASGENGTTAAITDAAARPLAAPKDDVVLKISGVQKGNAGSTVTELDMQTLESLPVVDTTIREPFLKRDIKFTGVRVGELLKAAGAGPGVDKVDMHALDDYSVALRVDDLVKSGAVLATRADGKRIKIAKGGPIRIIFDADTPTARNTDQWIWSVDEFRLQGS